jgi:4-hydroxy-tetrahydrodipicolinate synthase
VKEASGSLDQVTRVVEACGPNFTVLSGDDSLTLPMLAVGARGVIAVISNLMPEGLLKLVRAGLAGDFTTARAQHYALLPLMRAMGLETNPIPIKAALAAVGLIENELRLPLTRLTDASQDQLKVALAGAKLV